MSTTWNGNHTPAQDDMWNLVEDMRKQAILNNRVIPVFSKSERDGLDGAAPDGIIPDGTVVVRMDQVNKGAMFDVFADGKWVVGDTGIITSGINVQAAPNFTIDSYSFVRTGATVTSRIDMTYTGTDVTGGSDGNFADMNAFTLPSEWAPIWATYNISWYRPGRLEYFGRVDSGGNGILTHGLPNATIPKGETIRMDGSWRIA